MSLEICSNSILTKHNRALRKIENIIHSGKLLTKLLELFEVAQSREDKRIPVDVVTLDIKLA